MSEPVANEVDLSQPGETEEAPSLVELSMDDLFKIAVDNEGSKQVLKDLLIPAGTYTTEPPLTAAVGRAKDGREQVRLFGTIVLGERSEKIGYTLSWQRRNKAEGYNAGKPDSQSVLWAQAQAAYRAVYQAEPETIGQVVAYLRDYPHRLQVIQIGTGPNAKGTPGNMVVGINPVLG